MSSPGPSFRLYGPGTQVHAFGEVVGDDGLGDVAAVDVGQAGQGHDVGAGNPKDGQLGQFLVVRVRRHGATQRLEGGGNGVHAGPLPGVGLHPPLPRHVLVVLARLPTAAAAVGAVVVGQVAVWVWRLAPAPGQVLCHLHGQAAAAAGARARPSRGRRHELAVTPEVLAGDRRVGKARVGQSERERREGRRGEAGPTVRGQVEARHEAGGGGQPGREEGVVAGPAVSPRWVTVAAHAGSVAPLAGTAG